MRGTEHTVHEYESIQIYEKTIEKLSNDHNNINKTPILMMGFKSESRGFIIMNEPNWTVLYCKNFDCTEKFKNPLPCGVLIPGK